MAKANKSTKAMNAWELNMNPLRNLTSNQIEWMLDLARHGNDVKLQTAFYQMERTMPIFSICIQKRISGVLSRKWKITPIDATPDALGQADAVQKIFDECDMLNENGLTEAIKHLCLSTFRGRSCAKPFIEDGKLIFKPIQNWNILDHNGVLYWNPNISFESYPLEANLEIIPNSEVICLRENFPIDIPGMQIYLRQLVGECQWARFVEKQGIPQILITAPEGTPDNALDVWNQRAMQIYEGGSGVLPPGAVVNEMTSARGQDPFSAFCQHQMEMIAILATGGSLATIGGATGLGSNLADVQNNQFQQLISQDCKRISNAITNIAVRKVCTEILKAKPLCRFTYTEDDDTTPSEYLDMAQKAYAMGMTIDVAEFKKITGLQFIKDGSEKAADDIWTPSKTEAE